MVRRTLTAAFLVQAAAWSDSASMVQVEWAKDKPGAKSAAATFMQGELVEALDDASGAWYPSHVIGPGKQPHTFTIAVPDKGVAKDVPAVSLRRALKYREGDLVEVHDLKNDQWYPGAVDSESTKEKNSYNVDVPINGGVLPSVPAIAMRRATRFTSQDLVEIMVPSAGNLWAPGTIVGDGAKPGTYDINAHEAGLLKDVSPLAVRRATTVSPGDLVDVYDGESKKWTQSTVLSNGTKPGTFLLVAQDVGYLYDVPSVAVRKAAVHGDTVIGSTLQKDELVEYLDQVTGGWIPAIVKDNGTRPDSYVVEAPVVGKTFDINVASLRRVDRLREGDLSETLDEKTGVWVAGTVVGDGRLPYTVDITVPTFGFFPDIPINKVRHWVKPQTGEVMEVYDYHAKRWHTCRVLGAGAKEDTYNLAVPKVGRVADVGEAMLRRIAKPKF